MVRRRWSKLAGLAVCLTGTPCHAATAEQFATCDAEVSARPGQYESALCYYRVATRAGAWDAAGTRLRAMQDRNPEDPWLRLVYAHVLWGGNGDGAEAAYRTVAREFASAGNLQGELVARSNLRALLFRAGNTGAAADQVARIAEIAELTDDSELRVRALVDQARHDVESATNLSRALRTLLRAEFALSPEHPYWLRKEVLNNLGLLGMRFGRYDDAHARFRRLAVDAAANDDLSGLALARFNLANAAFERLMASPESGALDELVPLARSALATAQQAQDEHVAVITHRLLAELLANVDPARARAHLERCNALAERLAEPGIQSECMWNLASLIAPENAAGAASLISTAVGLMEEYGDQNRLAHAWRHHMRISWQTRPFAVAVADAQRALDVFESLRDLQPDQAARTGVLSAWTRDYYWLSGRLLERARQRNEPDLLAQAFGVVERMRARALLEVLQHGLPPPASARSAEYQSVLQAIVRRNRQLLAAADPPVRARILQDLARLEQQELGLREARYSPSRLPEPRAPLTRLAEVQANLSADEAMLSFQIAPWQDATHAFAGGAWVVAVTQDAKRAFPLSDPQALADAVTMMGGMLRAGHDTADAEVALYHRILADPLAWLPRQVTRLLIVADYPLHRLPFATLRRGPEQPPLGTAYEMSLVPSATLWRHWRRKPSHRRRGDALVFANPSIHADASQTARWRSWAAQSGIGLGRLPYADVEAGHVSDRLGAAAKVLTGAAATEAALKSIPLDDFAILHFATHAVVDEAHPERSAVVLAAGNEHEDGLLQVREIVDLPLAGKVVILSACQSATGAHVRGEGVQSLARAFFAAGAHAVVGSLWQVRDDHTAAFFDAFYATLARGDALGTALRAAQQRLRSDGYPATAWAGFQILGNDRERPLAIPSSGRQAQTDQRTRLWVVAAIAAALIAGAVGAHGLSLARRRARQVSAIT